MVMDLDGQVAKSKTKWGQVSCNFHFCFSTWMVMFFLFLASFIIIQVFCSVLILVMLLLNQNLAFDV